MKLRTLAATLALGVAASLTSAHAQATDPCSVYLCMAGISGYGTSGGPACMAPIAYWHTPAPAGLAVYHPYFNPVASYALRRSYMTACPAANLGTNAAAVEAILAEWGSEP